MSRFLINEFGPVFTLVRNSVLFPMAVLSLSLSAAAGSAQGGSCTDIPLRFTLLHSATVMNLDGNSNGSIVPSAIVGDGNDVYTNGSGLSATIKCDTSDAVLNLIVSKRKVTAILPAPILNSGANSQTPPAGSYTDNGVLNVRNILCQGCSNPGQPFVTRGGVELDSMYNRATYHVLFLPVQNISTISQFAPDLDNDASWTSVANTPNASSLVLVLPQPYNCSTTPGGTQAVYPSWIVRGTLQNQATTPSYLQLGTLIGSGNAPAGQFSMPFEYKIEALSCFHPY